MQGVADVEELLLPVQLELVQRFRPRLPPEAINFLTVYTNDVAQIAVPPENRAEHVVKLVERHLIGDRDQADDHRAHLAQNRSQNQAFEGGCFNHLSRLLGSRPPTFWRSPNFLRDTGTLGDALIDLLDVPPADEPFVIQTEIRFEQRKPPKRSLPSPGSTSIFKGATSFRSSRTRLIWTRSSGS